MHSYAAEFESMVSIHLFDSIKARDNAATWRAYLALIHLLLRVDLVATMNVVSFVSITVALFDSITVANTYRWR